MSGLAVERQFLFQQKPAKEINSTFSEEDWHLVSKVTLYLSAQ
jgi:hypothetical protein